MHDCLSHVGGWQVYSTGSPLEGLQLAALEQPDAILFDLSTNGMNFFSFLKRLGICPETQTIPVVLVAAGVKWLDSQPLQSFQVVGIIDDLSNPSVFSDQIAKLLHWDETSFKA